MKNDLKKSIASVGKIILNTDQPDAKPYIEASLPIGPEKDFKVKFRLSRHGLKRAAQRSFNYQTLLMVLILGTAFYRQGMTFFTVMERDIPEYFDHKEAEKVKNLVVVLGNDHDQIVTCYYSPNAVKHLRRKSKVLK